MNLVFGFDKVEEGIKHLIENNTLHHCNMFIGEKGIGKSKFVYNIATFLLSQRTNNSFDNIENTFKLVENKSHPDLLILDINSLDINGDENTGKKGEINVDQARVITNNINFTNSLSKNKVIVIDSIDETNIQAQNVLLKTLEEPPVNAYIFLVCHNINKVLPTILSRVNIIKINKLSFDDYKNALVKTNKNATFYDEESLKLFYNMSNSSISKSLNIIENNGLELYENILNCITQKDIVKIQQITKDIENKDEIFQLFKLIMENIFFTLINYFTPQNCIFRNYFDKIIANLKPKTIFEKYDYYANLINDINTYNLSKMHCITVLLQKF